MNIDNTNQNEEQPKRRTIRDIPITRNGDTPRTSGSRPSRNEINLKERPAGMNKQPLNFDSEFDEETFQENHTKGSGLWQSKKFWLISGVVLFILIIGFALTNLFRRAQLNLTIMSADITVSGLEIPIHSLNTATNGQLAYRELEFSKTADTEVDATQEEMVRQKAEGTITVYNTYSSNDQNWIQNTRFESARGLIYRTPTAVTIPGYTETDGRIVPGQIDVFVEADDFGPQYNLERGTKFTVPAFKGQDSYELFEATAITGISGGFDGVRKIVTEEATELAQRSLEQNLRSSIQTEVDSQIPQNLIVFYDLDDLRFEQLERTDLNQGVQLSLTATIKTLVIDKGELAGAIAHNKLNDYRSGEKVRILNLSDLEITLSEDEDQKTLNISGNVQIIWNIDEERLVQSLRGQKESAVKDILVDYRGVTSANTKFRPVWRRTFPDNPKRIIINKN